MKRSISIILVLLMTVLCVSCGKDGGSSGNGYNFETDFQINTMQANSTAMYTLSPTGVYTIQGAILRYFENGGTGAVTTCTRPECMHADWGTNTHECDAYVGMAVSGLMYYNGYLYIASFDPMREETTSMNTLTEYTLQGKYVRTVADLPDSLQYIIQHRGVFYYIYCEETDDNEILYKLSYVTADGRKSGVISQGENENCMIAVPSAYGKYLYFNYMEYSGGENLYHMVIYNTETGETSKLDKVQKVYFVNDKLLYVRLENGMICTSDLDGTNEKEYIKLDNVNALLYAYDDVVIASNLDTYDASDGWVCEFALYKGGKFIRTFNVDDFTSGEWDENRVTYNMFHTDDYVYMTVSPENRVDFVLVRFDRANFEKGIFEPVVMDVEATSNDSDVVYGD
ncbi:MAG: hypothetical protein IJ017_08215 [Oscillospiraceae bacterium]|nr:hypothetical protein [Oscillospiraceae bacterium]